jgi:hypothetical protein
MVTFGGFTCCDDCYCCNYHCSNKCNYHFFEECYFSFKYISYIEDWCESCGLVLPLCVFPLLLDIISCPCRCCYQECYKKCFCTKMNAVNAQNNTEQETNQAATTITQQPKIKVNNKVKKDLMNLPPHYDDHYNDSSHIINIPEVLPPLYR